MMKKSVILFFMTLSALTLRAQEHKLSDAKEISNSHEFWTGFYTKYKLTDKVYYYGEYHYRRRNDFVKDIAQVYLRFGATYLVNKHFELTGGFVTPIYWAPDQNAENIDPIVMQYRLWEQLLFVQPMGRAKIYHQLRFEQRWRRDYQIESPFELTHRFRYKFSMYIPLNNTYLSPKTVFFSFYEEVFIQAGKSITYNHFEDNRVFNGIGYIFNPNIQMQVGYMWTFRHAGGPMKYENRHIPRVSFYHNLDFHRNRRKETPILLHEF